MGRFTGKTILITGATNGIGLAGARRIASEGGTVFATGTDAQRIERLADTLPDGHVWHNDAGGSGTGRELADLVDRTGALLDGCGSTPAMPTSPRSNRSMPRSSTA